MPGACYNAGLYSLFNLGRHLTSVENYRYFQPRAFVSWRKDSYKIKFDWR